MEWLNRRSYNSRVTYAPLEENGHSGYTIKEGEAIAIHRKNGAIEILNGPQRIDASSCKVQKLPNIQADLSEYLRIIYKNGVAEHIRGPVSMQFNPIEMTSIEIMTCINVSTGEDDKSIVHRRVVRGPTVYMLGWHGSNSSDKTEKVPNGTKFTKLRITPDKFYFNVRDVRSSDDALITAKLMIFFQLENIEVMLDRTHDPVAVFINGASADVVQFISQMTYEEFVRRTSELSDLKTYGNLCRQAADVGYGITNVAWRGYKSTTGLQTIHDSAIKQRTQLVLQNETENQTQDLADLKLQRDAERAAETQKMQLDNVTHELKMTRANAEHSETKKQEDLEQKIRHDREKLEMDVTDLKSQHDRELAELEHLRQSGVDLTQYLVRNEKKLTEKQTVEVVVANK